MGTGLPDGLVAGGAQRDPDQHLRNLRGIDFFTRLIPDAQGPIRLDSCRGAAIPADHPQPPSRPDTSSRTSPVAGSMRSSRLA